MHRASIDSRRQRNRRVGGGICRETARRERVKRRERERKGKWVRESEIFKKFGEGGEGGVMHVCRLQGLFDRGEKALLPAPATHDSQPTPGLSSGRRYSLWVRGYKGTRVHEDMGGALAWLHMRTLSFTLFHFLSSLLIAARRHRHRHPTLHPEWHVRLLPAPRCRPQSSRIDATATSTSISTANDGYIWQ